MITINYENDKYKIKNSLDEFTINEFEEICFIISSENMNRYDKWYSIFTYLGLPIDVCDDLDAEYFNNIVDEFNVVDVENVDIYKEIIINDKITLKAYDEKFKLTVKESRLIENFCIENKNKNIAGIMAILYKNEDVDDNMKYDVNHLKYKEELIKHNVTADKCIPILKMVSNKMIKDYKNMVSENV
jgi:hypothetical protein